MQTSYDVVVIGSGVGGMGAAIRLATAGYKVLVLEKMPVVGGRFASMEYKGFTLSTGAEALECEGALEEAFHLGGVPMDGIRRPSPDIMYRVGDREFELPPGGGGLRRILSFLGQPGEGEKVMGAMKRALQWHEPSKHISVKDWVGQYTSDPDIHGFFQVFCAAIFAINANEASAWTFIRFIKAMGGKIIHGFAPEGPSKLMDGLAKGIVDRGGDVWTKARVKRILTEEGVVRGVVAEKGGDQVEISARAVISNTGPRTTAQLAGRENFDRAYLRLMDETLRPAPSVAVYVSSDRPLMEHPGVLMPVGTRRACYMLTPTILCPELAPRGRHLMVSFSAFGDSLGPANLDEEIRLNIEDLRELFPHFDSHAEVLMAGTFYKDWPVYHSWPGCELPPKTPIENLYNVGDGVKEPGWIGLEASAQTGRLVAEDVQARLRKR
ncbi:MAG TPA: FAD-dependent oxidoreductase [Dehalococcoidia bacterium]|nr:FAD-dependent oxidoreductase [Dehalococcoidia bacterium]